MFCFDKFGNKQTCAAVILIVSIVFFDRHDVPFAAKRAVCVNVVE